MSKLLDGKALRLKKLELLKNKLLQLNEKLGLAVVQVGDNEASNIYLRNKEKLALELGYDFIHKKLPSNVTEDELIDYINYLNDLDNIDGIIVQMPLPDNLDESRIQNSISTFKDVDGLTFTNQGRILHNKEGLVPCTPKGIIDLLEEYNIPLEGANVVMIGRSVLVGRPLSVLLTNKNATVSLLHSKTKNLTGYTRNADILIVSVGIKGFIKEDMVKDNCVVVDVGINRENGKIYGDVDFDSVSKKVSYITPTPGGVGPMTTYELMDNVYEAHVLRKGMEK